MEHAGAQIRFVATLFVGAVAMLHIASTMLRSLFSGALLGFIMLPWWALAAAAASIALAIVLGRRSGASARRKWLLSATVFLGSALVFFGLAVWSADYYCSRPPPDGLCIFAGFPFLALCTLYLAVALVALIQFGRAIRRTHRA